MGSKAPCLACAVGLLWWCAPLPAATRTVTDLGDSGLAAQLRAQINAAAPGDTVVLPAGTITLKGAAGEDLNASGDLDILKNLTIQGAGAGVTIIDGGAVDGVFDVLAPYTLTLSGVTIRNGISAQAGGGGIRNFGTLNLAHAVVSGNEAARGSGGIRNFGGGIRNLSTMTLTDVTITGNVARGGGGGIHNERGAVMRLTDVTVSANRVEIDGGGIYNLGTAVLLNVTLSGNTADSSGGGLFSGAGATATLTNATLSGNRASASGGGLYNSAAATLTNVTVSANTAAFSGGGVFNAGSAALLNVILSGNSDVLVAGTANCSGPITSLGHNLENGATCGLGAAADLSGTDPLLGLLQNNGGLTPTHALLPGSPAIDGGANAGCPAADQRGFPRDAACDIGAFEFANAAPAQPAISPNGILNGASFQPLIAGGGFATIFGRNFTDRQSWWDSAILDGRTLPATLGGVQVRINGKTCFVNYASPAQINVLVPPDTAAGAVAVEVVTRGGTASATATMAPYSPGLFSYPLGGKLYAAAVFASTGVYVAQPGALAGVSSRAARPGDYLELYATGLGPTSPPYPGGEVLTHPYVAADLSQLRVTVGGVTAAVLYAGMTYAGVFQINIQVPQGIGAGDLAVQLTMAGYAAQANPVLPFQQ